MAPRYWPRWLVMAVRLPARKSIFIMPKTFSVAASAAYRPATYWLLRAFMAEVPTVRFIVAASTTIEAAVIHITIRSAWPAEERSGEAKLVFILSWDNARQP